MSQKEAYRSLYGDLAKLKDQTLLKDPAGGTGQDTELWQLLAAVSEWVDRYCNRHFYPRVQTLEFDGLAETELLIPDLVAITSLKTDDNEDQTFETTWAATDYWLLPLNADPTSQWGEPYTRVKVRKQGTKSQFDLKEQLVEIAGRWGYREYKEDSGSNINDAGGISTTDTTVGVTAGTDFAIGMTILIESEQMLVTDIAANNLTVARALNGTTGATHADATDVFILRWPVPVERATLIQAARIYSRATVFEPFFVDADLDTDVRMLLDSYRRLGV